MAETWALLSDAKRVARSVARSADVMECAWAALLAEMTAVTEVAPSAVLKDKIVVDGSATM